MTPPPPPWGRHAGQIFRIVPVCIDAERPRRLRLRARPLAQHRSRTLVNDHLVDLRTTRNKWGPPQEVGPAARNGARRKSKKWDPPQEVAPAARSGARRRIRWRGWVPVGSRRVSTELWGACDAAEHGMIGGSHVRTRSTRSHARRAWRTCER